MNGPAAGSRLWTETLGTGPDLFLVHGWGLNAGVWSPLMDALAGRYRVTTVDLPGHGHSPYTGPFTLDSLAAQLLTAAPRRSIWLGWSLGGLAALAAASHAPERIGALCLTAAGPRFTRATDWPDAVPGEVLAGFATGLEDDYHRTLNRFLALQVRGSRDAGATLKLLKRDLFTRGEPSPAALAAGLEILRSSDLRGSLGQYPGAVQFIMGERDTLNPPAAADTCAARMQRAKVSVLAGAGHAPFLSHRDPFLQILNDFVSANTPKETGARAHG